MFYVGYTIESRQNNVFKRASLNIYFQTFRSPTQIGCAACDEHLGTDGA